jgi:hypothetical protein
LDSKLLHTAITLFPINPSIGAAEQPTVISGLRYAATDGYYYLLPFESLQKTVFDFQLKPAQLLKRLIE